MPRTGGGKGKWRSLKTGRFVSAYYALRDPKHVEEVEERDSGGTRLITCPECGEAHVLVRVEGG